MIPLWSWYAASEPSDRLGQMSELASLDLDPGLSTSHFLYSTEFEFRQEVVVILSQEK